MFEKVGLIRLPEVIINYIEENGDRLQIEQSAYDAMNGYVLEAGTRIKIQRFCEYCTICGWHSLTNKNQKRLIAERKHRIERRYETIFQWDNYSPDGESLEAAFRRQLLEEDG